MNVRCALRIILYLWDIKKCFLENWVGAVILEVLGQYTFSVLFIFWSPFLNKKSVIFSLPFHFYCLFFWLQAMAHHIPLLLVKIEELLNKVRKSSGHFHWSLEFLFENFRTFRLYFVFHLYKLYGEPEIRVDAFMLLYWKWKI